MFLFQVSMNVGSVHLASPWHQFRAFSELKNESRGGYIEGEICVPAYVSRIRISLVNHGPTREPHVNLLFETPRNKLVSHCQEMKPSDHDIVLHKVNDAFELQQPSYWLNNQVNRPQFWINGKLVLGTNNLQLTVCKAVQKGQSKISVSEMIKYLNLRQFNGDLEKARLKVIFDDNPPIYSKVILDKAKYLIKIDTIRTTHICDRADQLLTIYFNKSVKITQDKCLKLTLFRNICSVDIHFTNYRIVSENVVDFKVNASRIGACANVYVVVSIDDRDIDGSSLYDQISDDLTIDIKKHFEHPEFLCFCKLNSAADFKPTKVRSSIRTRPYPSTSVPCEGQPVASTYGGARSRTIRRPQRPNQSFVDPSYIRQPHINMYTQEGKQQPAVQEPQVRQQLLQNQLQTQSVPSTSKGARPRTMRSSQSNADPIGQGQAPGFVPQGRELPPGWEAHSYNGRTYYANNVTRITQWEHPGSQDRHHQSRPSQPHQPTLQNFQLVGQPQLQQTNPSSRPQPTLSHAGFSSRPQGSLGPIPTTVPSVILQDSDSDEGSWQFVTQDERPPGPLATGDGPPQPQVTGQRNPEPSRVSSNVGFVGAIREVPVDKSEEDDLCLSVNALTILTDDEEDQGGIFVHHVANAGSSSGNDVSDQDDFQSDRNSDDQHEVDQNQEDQWDQNETSEYDQHDSDQAQDDYDYENCNDYDDYYNDYDYSSDYTSD